MKARAATVGDLETVFHDLSSRISEEYAASGTGSGAAHDRLMMNLGEGRAHALLGDDGTPLAIIAWHETNDVAHTLFAAQESFFSASTVRFCRNHIRRIQKLAGNLPLRHQSFLDRADVARWFRILGFADKGTDSGARLFELPPAPTE